MIGHKINEWTCFCFISLLLLGQFSCQTSLPSEVQIAYQQLPEVIDFNFDVKPILSDKCFACHGPDKSKQQGNLRLDVPQSAFGNLTESGLPAIRPHNIQKSQLVRRVLSTDEEIRMPPRESHLTLSNTEKATLLKWVEQGADYKPHWSFLPLEKKALPNKHWGNNPIDYFINEKLEESGLNPSEKANKETLIRRVSFDLTGLPPSLEAINQFVNDPNPKAYENLIDQLLATPAYGERMAMDWMDVARYADSDGYLDDKHREFSPWRDWIIEAFNQNMPYDQFVSWQLAGDLLEDAPKESTLATAFYRLHRKNSEAGIVFEEFRVENVADRTLTLGKAFMGLTLECARCHDHKYDPISQEDYFKLFGFFNSTHEIGHAVYGPDQTPGPALLLSTEQQDSIAQFIAQKIQQQEIFISKLVDNQSLDYQSWLSETTKIIHQLKAAQQNGLVAYYPFDIFRQKADKRYQSPAGHKNNSEANIKEPNIKEGKLGNALFLNDYTSLELPKKVGWFDRFEPFSVSFSLFPDTLYDKEVGVFYHCENLRLGLRGYSLFLKDNRLRFILSHSWPQNAIEVVTKTALNPKEWTDITITYDGSSKAEGIQIYLNGEAVALKVNFDNLYKSITHIPDIHTYGFAGFHIGSRDKMETFKKGGYDELKIYNRSLSSLEVLYQFDPKKALAVVEAPQSVAYQRLLATHYFEQQHPASLQVANNLKTYRTALSEHLDSIPEIMVMGDLPEPRPTFVLDRGIYDAPTKKVQPGVPENILAYDDKLPRNRLGLAQWLFDPKHPLTARVYVNRIWQMHFGRGLVKTVDDFGNQGDLPSHPELLDWLAIHFIASNWDIKNLHKTILLSATYQQSSKVSPELYAVDAENILLARGPRFRLPAEMIRDNALSISSLLVNKLGGTSVYPYQPAGLWDEISNKHWRYKYLQQPGEGLYRRSLYTVWKRTAPPPSMMIFDAPDRTTCTVNRRKTSTPLQALVLLNDPQYIEAARVLAEKLLLAFPDNRAAQLKQAFQLATGRTPTLKESKMLGQYFTEEQDRFLNEPKDALAYINIGETNYNTSLDPTDIAALATVVSGIMNTSEAYTKQ